MGVQHDPDCNPDHCEANPCMGASLAGDDVTWLDVMSAIPLARGVPVVNASTGARWVICSQAKAIEMGSNPRMRVDLDDDQGFGYALRQLLRMRGYDIGGDVESRWWHGKTTDADRLALAIALREGA